MNRLTDDRFVGNGFYQPKSRDEQKEIMLMDKPSYMEIYNRLAWFETLLYSGEKIK